jgi:hypothetical protein
MNRVEGQVENMACRDVVNWPEKIQICICVKFPALWTLVALGYAILN